MGRIVESSCSAHLLTFLMMVFNGKINLLLLNQLGCGEVVALRGDVALQGDVGLSGWRWSGTGDVSGAT